MTRSVGYFIYFIISNLNFVFIEWVNSLAGISKGQVAAIDRKIICGVKSSVKSLAIHLASAWASENNLVLGQVKLMKSPMKL